MVEEPAMTDEQRLLKEILDSCSEEEKEIIKKVVKRGQREGIIPFQSELMYFCILAAVHKQNTPMQFSLMLSAGAEKLAAELEGLVKAINLDTWKLEGYTPIFSAGDDVRRCRACGCTDDNCLGCVERTGEPCLWVEADLCSACEKGDETIKEGEDNNA